MENFKMLTVLVLGILLTLGSCRKYDQGPQGIKGEPGAAGPKGEPGPKGDPAEQKTGIGNALFSDWTTVSFALQTNGFWRATWNVSSVTPTILSQGSVIVYMKRDGSVYKLDYYTNTESFTQRIDVGQIWLYGSFDPAPVQFRYIIIPPREAAAGLAKLSSREQGSKSIDYNNYEEVCKYYGVAQ